MHQAAERTQPLAIGDRVLDRYIIESKIAVGGHSVVYRGIDERLSRPVCVKAFHKLATEEGIWKTAYEHFVQEAFALSKLSHPNTLRIYDFGQVDHGSSGKFPVQVSEFMAGGTLAHLVGRGGVMELQDVVDSIGKLAEALAEAHRLDIIHRDIKPQNILFTVPGEDREPKLADFGIAKSVSEDNMDNQAENTEVVVGFPLAMFSPSWGAPEQLCGDDPTPSIDIYSLGLVSVFALTGKAICKSTSAQEGYELRRHAPEMLEELLEGLSMPTTVVHFLKRACAFDAKERPKSAVEFCKQFREAFHTRPKQRLSGGPFLESITRKSELPHANLQAQGTDSSPKLAVPTNPAVQAKASQPPAAPPSPAHIQSPPPSRTIGDGSAMPLSRVPAMQQVGTRTCQFLEFKDECLLLQLDAARIKVSYTPAPESKYGRTLTIRGMTSFLALAGGRPSSAVHLEDNGELELLDGRRTKLGSLHISFGRHEAGYHHFQIGDATVCLSASECRMPILIDNADQQQSFFLYVP